MPRIAVFVGSLRHESINRKLAEAMGKLAAPTLEFAFVDLSDLPHYNDDLWAHPPAAVLRIKREIERSDAVLFVTPEYNRSVPGVLKDAIDWASRPWGKNSWAGKPGAIAGASGGKIGTAVAQSQIRSSLVVLDVALMGQPEAYIQVTPGLIDESANVTDPSVEKFLVSFVAAFTDWIGKISTSTAEPAGPDIEPALAAE